MSTRGIDYGMGSTNIDRKTGIRFGVISMHALADCACEDFEAEYGDSTCPKCGGEVVESSEAKCEEAEADFYCENCNASFWSDQCYGDEPLGFLLDDGEYLAEQHEDNDIFIVKSPYYTRAQFCSPCAPGACHLEHPTEEGEKCYCFDGSWFSEGKAPYPVYRVSDNSLVESE